MKKTETFKCVLINIKNQSEEAAYYSEGGKSETIEIVKGSVLSRSPR